MKYSPYQPVKSGMTPAICSQLTSPPSRRPSCLSLLSRGSATTHKQPVSHITLSPDQRPQFFDQESYQLLVVFVPSFLFHHSPYPSGLHLSFKGQLGCSLSLRISTKAISPHEPGRLSRNLIDFIEILFPPLLPFLANLLPNAFLGG